MKVDFFTVHLSINTIYETMSCPQTECQNDTTDNPTWVCPDRSDAKICSASECDKKEYFPCTDDSFCIYNGLICDGYKQCPDGSDEANCGKCPPTEGPGFPLRPVENTIVFQIIVIIVQVAQWLARLSSFKSLNSVS